MSNSTSSDNPVPVSRLSDHWTFSTDTALRIPDLLRDVRTRLQWHDLTVLKDLKKRETAIKLDFTRRLLTGSDQVTQERAYQFTYSDRFEQFRTRTGDSWKFLLRGASVAHNTFKNHISPGKKLYNSWHFALTCFERANHDSSDQHLVRELKRLTADSFAGDNHKQIFDSLTVLYAFYTRIPFVGFLTSVLDRAHFQIESTGKDDVVKQGRPKTLAYLIQLKEANGQLKPVIGLWRIDGSGYAHNLIPNNETKLDQPPARYFPCLKDNAVGFGVNIADVHTALWRIFNKNSPPDYHLAIPIYDTDDLGGNTPQSQKPIVVQGAFLGWLFLMFPKAANRTARLLFAGGGERGQPNWVSSTRRAKPNRQLATDLRRIRHVLNRFSEMYLLGEMEWALERELKPGKTAIDFTTDHFHHCNGWVGEPLPQNLPSTIYDCYALFCRQDHAGLSAIQPEDKDRWKPDEITHLLVNVTRSMQRKSSSSDRRGIVCLRRREDTAIPADRVYARECCNRIAKSVKQMYEQATLLEQRRQQGQKGEWQRFGHELKHLSFALSRRWLIDPSKAVEGVSGSKLVPFPDLLSAVGTLIHLWCPNPNFFEFLIDDDQRTSVARAASVCWGQAVASLCALAVKGKNLNNASEFKAVSGLLAESRRAFDFAEWWGVTENDELWVTIMERSKDHEHPLHGWMVRVLRVLIIVMRDTVRHAALADNERSNQIILSEEGISIVCNTAPWRDADSSAYPEVAILRSASNASAGIGYNLLQGIVCGELHGTIERTIPSVSGQRYSLHIVIPFPK